MKMFSSAPEVEEMAASVKDSGGVTLVPALVGMGAPYWRADARGLICGITRGTTSAHIARAALEGIALQNYDILKAMEKDLTHPLAALKVDGGAAANNLLIQFQCDILGVRISRPCVVETTAQGAALLAGLATGFWKDAGQIGSLWREDRSFEPGMRAEEVAARVGRWHEAVKRA
jgi:glycerol kinase